MPHIPIPPPFTGKGLTNLTGKAIITSTPKRNYRLTEEHKIGIQKMIGYFDGFGIRDIEFQIWIGVLPDGTPHRITLNGMRIVKHLRGVLDFEVYGEDGRDILNGIRECYANDRFQRGFPIGK